MNNKYKLFLFDFDLTLADGSAWIISCYQQVLHQHGFTQVANDDVRKTIGMTVENSFSQMTGLHDAADLALLRGEYRALCRPQMAAHTSLFADAHAFLLQAHREGIKLGIISTKQSFVIRQSLQTWGIEDLFALVFGIDEVTSPKPSPSGVLKAAEALNVSLSEVLFFGDSLIDAQTAKNAGVDFVGISKGIHSKEELEAYPHLLVSNQYEEVSANLF